MIIFLNILTLKELSFSLISETSLITLKAWEMKSIKGVLSRCERLLKFTHDKLEHCNLSKTNERRSKLMEWNHLPQCQRRLSLCASSDVNSISTFSSGESCRNWNRNRVPEPGNIPSSSMYKWIVKWTCSKCLSWFLSHAICQGEHSSGGVLI